MANPVLAHRYEVQRSLGQKAERRTVLARDLITQSLVVIKILSVDNYIEWDDLKLFEREAEILKTLSHPSLPRYLDYFEVQLRNGKGLAIVESFIEGQSLESYLQAGRKFTEPETKQIARALLEILIYLQKRQPPIMHRDIKPSNVLLTQTPDSLTSQLYLIDFGSVKLSTGQENSNFTLVGTYGYMPPEQFSGRTVLASDLYSLGATLIALLTSTHPSSLMSGSRIDFDQTNLSPAFAQWLRKMTEPMLERRLQSAPLALQALEQEQVPTPRSQKPAETRINLTRTADLLEITLPSSFGQVCLRIDPQQLSLSSQMLGLKYSRPVVARRQEVNKLERQKSSLILWAGTQKFELGNGTALTDAELHWLMDELSDWLKIPITS